MAPPSITIGLGLGAAVGAAETALPAVVQTAPATVFDAVPGADSVTITVSAPAHHAGSYSVALSALAAGPVNLVAPLLSATAATVGETLAVQPGLWVASGAFPPPLPAFAWLRDGVEIPGATSPVYTVAAADAGATLHVRETAEQAGTGARSVLSATATVANDTWLIIGTIIQSFPRVPVPGVSGTTVTAGA